MTRWVHANMDPFHRNPNGRETPIERDMAANQVRLARATRQDAAPIHRITQAAYAEYRRGLHPPSEVDRETLADVARPLDEGGAVLAWISDDAVGAVRVQAAVYHVSVERLAVIPTARGHTWPRPPGHRWGIPPTPLH
jgi:hypothetical protein